MESNPAMKHEAQASPSPSPQLNSDEKMNGQVKEDTQAPSAKDKISNSAPDAGLVSDNPEEVQLVKSRKSDAEGTAAEPVAKVSGAAIQIKRDHESPEPQETANNKRVKVDVATTTNQIALTNENSGIPQDPDTSPEADSSDTNAPSNQLTVAELEALTAKFCDRAVTVRLQEAFKALIPLTKAKATDQEKMDCAEMREVSENLAKLDKVTMITLKLAKSHVKHYLEQIDKVRHFTRESKRKAAELLRRFELQEWGNAHTVVQRGDGDDDSAAPVVNNPTITTTTTQPGTTIGPAGRKNTGKVEKERRYAPANHDIYGRNGIMRGIGLSRSVDNHRTAYILDDRITHTSAKVYGDNGLAIGYWVPLRICLLRDGAHGHLQAGVYPGTRGAISIIISEGYAGIDEDSGDHIKYSGPYKEADKSESEGTLALRKSVETQADVRVIRGSGSGTYGPDKGYRYDGLYKVTAENRAIKAGKRYQLFTLVRNAGQRRIDHSRPTPQEKSLLAAIAKKF